MANQPKISGEKAAKRPAPGSGNKSGDEKKAIDRPIGQPDRAREEAPIGWDFGPDGLPMGRMPDEAGARPADGSDGIADSQPVRTGSDGNVGETGSPPDQASLDAATTAGGGAATGLDAPAHALRTGLGGSVPIHRGLTEPLVARSTDGQPEHGYQTPGMPGGAGGGLGGSPSSPEGDSGAPDDGRTDTPVNGGTDTTVDDGTDTTVDGGTDTSVGDGSSEPASPGGDHGGSGDTDDGGKVEQPDEPGEPGGGETDGGVGSSPPEISGTVAGDVQEDVTISASGQLTTSAADGATWSLVGDGAGPHGSLTLNPDGSWSYALDNDVAQGLRAGETTQDIFTLKVTDASGAEATQTITVTVTGTNDVPVISGAETGSVQEDATLTASGALMASDADIGDTASWSVVGDGDGSYGALTLNPDGSWSYALNNDAAQGLKAGETAQDIFTVKVTDAAGAEATQTVTVTVTGTNDTPVISGTATGLVGEDGELSAGGKLDASDADIGDTASWSVVGDGDSSYGALTLNPDGSWSYALNNDAAQGLKAGETAQDIFTVKVIDASGAEATQTVTVTVTGTNDTPVISGTATGFVGEDGELTAGGKLDASDADIGDTTSWSVVGDGDGSYGALTLNPDGSWSYALNNDAAQGLKAGETAQDIFTVKVTDAAGAEATQTITVTVTGTNDTPVISGTATGSVEEDGTQQVGGKLDVSDADIGDTASWSVVGDGDGSYGALTLNPDGSWSYSLNNDAAQGLRAGETAQDIFTVKVTDASGAEATQTVTVTVTGTNDVPVISGTETGLVREDEALTASGSLTVADADIGDSATWSVVGSADGPHGALTLNPDGSWSYALDNDAAQGLKAGETAQDIFTVKVTDAAGAETTQTITVTVAGTNDAPVIAGAETGSVQEDQVLTASGALTASDADIGDTASWAVVGDGDGSYGALTLNPDGSWSYALDNDAAQGLKAGETAQNIFTVKVTDASGAEATQTVTVTVTGTNDTPVISGVSTGSVGEDGELTAGGKLDASDADIGDTASWAVVGDGDGSYGALTLNPDGSWSYALDNDAAQGLKAGETAQDIFTVKVTDASGAEATQTVTVTVTGTNDAPVISGTATGFVGEDGELTAGGELDASDADVGDTASWSVVGGDGGAYGSLTLNPDGSWSYALDNDAAQGLKAGETAQDIFTVKVTDAAGAEATQTITVTVTGTNDAPVISGTVTGSVEEDGTQQVGGKLDVSDTDIGDSATWSIVGNADGSHGSLTLNPDGSWSYVLDNDAVQGLKTGETAQDIFTVKVTDASGAESTQTVTVTVTGTNDVPVISGTSTGFVGEDGQLTAGGKLDVSDADLGDAANWSVAGDSDSSYGSLTLNPDGSWSYALNNDAAQGLKAGETVQDIFTVKVTDAAGAEATQTITVTVTGTNDAPVISGAETASVQEDQTLTASGTLTVSDADVGDTADWSVVGTPDGAYGALTLNPDGSWSYALDNDAAQGLKAGETAQDIFTVKVTDASGASDTQTVTVIVTGTNDAPVISGTSTGLVEEDGSLTAGGKLDVLDADTGDTASWSVVDGDAGHYGSLTVDESGHWSYVLDNDKAQGLKAGETVQETFTVRVTDSAGASAEQTITISVGGTNDIPVITGTSTGQVQEDVTLTASGTLTAADADSGDTTTWSVDGSADSSHGTFAIDDSGHWTFTLDNDTAQSLKAGEVIHETFTVRATDSAGATVTQLVSVDITGTNDGPQVSQALNTIGSMKEDTSITFSADDLLRGAQVSDADHDTLTVTNVSLDPSSAPGTLVDNHNGTWTYTPPKNASNITPQINFSVSDGHQTVNAHASVSVQPVADPADVSITAGTVRDVISTGADDDLGRIVVPNLTTKALTEFTLEFTVIGKSVPESTTGQGPVIVNIGSPPNDKNTLTLWDPANMKVGMSKTSGGDVNIPTGINLTDGENHRITVTWDAKSNLLKVYDNGTLALTTTPPKSFPSTLYMSIAEKANTPPTTSNPGGGGYRNTEHFEGTIFNVAMSNKAETADQVKQAPLSEQQQDNLLIDVRAQDGKIVDTTGKHTISAVGGLHQESVPVDSSLASVPVGSTLHVDISTHLTDPNDVITHLDVSGFIAGTVLTDGTHTVTVKSPADKIDITDWSRDNVTAKLPDGVHQNMDLQVSATTSTPPYATGEIGADGKPVMGSDSATTVEDHQVHVEGATETATAAPLTTAEATPQETASSSVSSDDASLAASGIADHASSTTSDSQATTQGGDRQQTTDHPADSTTTSTDTGDTAAQSADHTTTAADTQTDDDGGREATLTEQGQESADAQTIIPDTAGSSVAADAGSTGTATLPEEPTSHPDTAATGTSGDTDQPQTAADAGTGGDGQADQPPETAANTNQADSNVPASGNDQPDAAATADAGGQAGNVLQPGLDDGSQPATAGAAQDQADDIDQANVPDAADGGVTAGGDLHEATTVPGDGAPAADIATPGTSTDVAGNQDATDVGTSDTATADADNRAETAAATDDNADQTTTTDTAAERPGSGVTVSGDDHTDITAADPGGSVSQPDTTGGSQPDTGGASGAIEIPQTDTHDPAQQVASPPDETTTLPGSGIVAGVDADPGAAAQAGGAGSDVTSAGAGHPFDAGGDISLVSVNDWYNPSWGGGYNATFQLTLTDTMLKGGSIEGWSLQIGINNPNAVVTTGWLDGFNGTVAFNPSTGTFSNEGQSYQPELHAGDTIQFSIQVQNTGYDRNDFSFSFQDLDPAPAAAAADDGLASPVAVAEHGDTSLDIGDAQSVTAWSGLIAGEQSSTTGSPADGTHPQTAAATPAEATLHADASATAGDDGASTAQAPDHGQATSDADHAAAAVQDTAAPDSHATDQGTPDAGAAEQAAAAGTAVHDQPVESAASAYLAFVQPQSDDHASAWAPADHPSSSANDYVQMAGDTDQAAQEPLSPDHLFADAQVDHSGTAGADTHGTQPDAVHDDAAAAAADAPAIVDHDNNHHGN